MSDCYCQKNIKKPEPTIDDVKKPTWDRPIVASAVTKKPDGLLMTSVTATGIWIFFGLRASRRRTTECITHIHVFDILNVIADSLPE